jgi:MoxR-like ATPase
MLLIVGKRAVLERITAVTLAGRHVLIEDYPGLAKTLIAHSFAATLSLEFRVFSSRQICWPGDITMRLCLQPCC